MDTAELSRLVAPYTKTGPERIAALIEALHVIDENGIDGDFVECGVWMGGNIIIARKVSPHRVCWLYDTFTGMTPPGREDMNRDGRLAAFSYFRKARVGARWCAASLEEVCGVLRETGVLDGDKLRFVVGDVCETLRVRDNLPERIALLRLDTDWYASTKVELEVLFPRLVPGGILIVDDYGHWQGARKAFDEYFGKVEFKRIDYSAIMLVKNGADNNNPSLGRR